MRKSLHNEIPCTRRAAAFAVSQEVGGVECFTFTISRRLPEKKRMNREETSCGWDSVPYGTSPVSGMDQMSQMVSVMTLQNI